MNICIQSGAEVVRYERRQVDFAPFSIECVKLGHALSEAVSSDLSAGRSMHYLW